MRGNLANREPEILQRWQSMNLYQEIRARRAGKKTFILHDGPPYANGDIHIGHAVNKILKDIIIKSRSLSGYDSPYVPGWDCHGLPIELMVEKQIAKQSGAKIPDHTFRTACRKYAEAQIARQRRDFQRLGVLGDWQKPYLTMDFANEANIIRTLGKLIAANHVYQGKMPVHWCLDCRSALAEAEVEYEDKHATAIDVKFRFVDQVDLLARFTGDGNLSTWPKPAAIVIWTTTPWTLPANQAVCLSGDQTYHLIDTGDQYLVLAVALQEEALQRYSLDQEINIKGHCLGSALEHLSVQHPLYDRLVPIILGEHVTMETGTGAVHTAPGHGQEDYTVAGQYGLPVTNPVDGNGYFLPDTELFAGEHVFQAEQHIIEILKDKQNLLHQESIRHSYPHCWRHKSPTIFLATPQWFISMDKNGLRKKALQAIEQVQWFPEWGQQRITGMVSGRPDWCISRQRLWGVPMTLFMDKQTGELPEATSNLIEQVAKQVEKAGIEAWFEIDQLPETDTDNYQKSTNTLDVWFDSGVTHASVLQVDSRLNFPADLYLEGSDQHRGWFQSSLLTSIAINGIAPYRSVLTHGFTVDAQGKKMAKSKGNVVTPQKIINALGADVLRLWVAATDYRSEMHVSDEILKRMVDTYRRFRNTARYLLANLHDFNPTTDCITFDDLLELDKWALDQAVVMQAEVTSAYADYQFHQVFQELQRFCGVEMSSFYFDIIKDRMYTTQQNSLARRSAQTTMYHIIEALVRWLAPVLSFTADEIWRYMPGERSASVFLEEWYEQMPPNPGADLRCQYWGQIIKLKDVVSKQLEKLRIAGEIGSALDAEVQLYCDAAWLSRLRRIKDELHFVLITSNVTLAAQSACPEAAVATDLAGITLKVVTSPYDKCLRCWHRRQDVDQDQQHPKLCKRCITNISAAGELRHYA